MLGDKRLEFVQSNVSWVALYFGPKSRPWMGTDTECELGSGLFFNRFTSQSYCKLAYSSKIMDLCLTARDLLMHQPLFRL